MRRAIARRSVVHLASVGALVLAAGVTACGSSSSDSASGAGSNSSNASPATVKLVEAGSEDFSSADVLYFVDVLKRQGVKVKFTGVSDASAGLRTVVSGQSDLFIGSLPTAIQAVSSGGATIKTIANNDQSSDYVLVAKKGVTLQNLSGKTLAIDTPGSAGHVAAQVGLRKAGADPKAVHYVTVGSSSARQTAVLAGRVDIAPLHYPDAVTALATGKVQLLLNVGEKIGPYLQSGLIASGNFIKDKAVAQKAVNAFIEAERWAASDKAAYLAYAKSHKLSDGLSDAQAGETWDFYRNAKFFGINGGMCSAYVDAFEALNTDNGSLPKPLPDRSSWLDASFVQSYLKAHNQDPNAC
jgi:ABC-type nitrate/sulfonate/bicarbonate transport system substrate-binding protein